MNTQELQHVDIDPDLLDKMFFEDPEQYLNEWKQSGQDIKQLSADGIFYLAGKLNIGVKEVNIKLSEDGKNYLATATAYDLNSHRTMIGNACVPLYYSGNRLNPNAYELASTLVQRNAIRKMIPHKQIMKNLQNFSNGKGSPTPSGPSGPTPPVQNQNNEQNDQPDPIEAAKIRARQAIENPDVVAKLAEKNLTANDVFKQAEIKGGASSEWTVRVWDAFTKSLHNIETSWISEWVDSKSSEPQSEEVPVEVEVQTEETTEDALLEAASEEETVSEEAEQEVSEDVDETKEQVRAETIKTYNTRKEELQDMGITYEMFWRLGVAKRYDVTQSDDLTINDWKHLGQSLIMPDFAEWIQELKTNNDEDE